MKKYKSQKARRGPRNRDLEQDARTQGIILCVLCILLSFTAAEDYVSKQTAADLLDEIDAAFPGAAKLMEDAHLTGAGPQLEVPEGLDINDPLAQAAKNDIMKAQGIQDGNGNSIDAPGDPVHQLAENAGEKIKFSQMTTDEAMKVAQKYRLKAPIEIPENATIKPVSKAGYEQISFGWRDETYKYGVRWHRELVTTYTKAEFDANMWKVIMQLFGE